MSSWNYFTGSVLVAALEANARDYYAHFRHWPAAQVHADPALFWFLTGIREESFNGVAEAQLRPQNIEQQIAAALLPFRERNLPMLWHIGPATRPVGLGRMLVQQGLEHYEDEPGMALDLSTFTRRPLPPGMQFQPILADDDLRAWLAVWAGPDYAQIMPAAYDLYRQRLNDPQQPLLLFLLRLDGIPVATSALFLGAGLASLQHVVTRPDMRKRGIGSAITGATLAYARNLGAQQAVLTASQAGLRIYQRLGFETYCMYQRYILPARP